MKNKLDKNSLLMIYFALILPYITYCSEIWGNTHKSKLDKIIVLEKGAMRIIGGLKYFESVSSTFALNNCLKFADIV